MTDSELAELLKHVSRVRQPTDSDKIHKDECVYSFDSPDSDTGLYLCLQTFLGMGRQYVERHFQATGNAVYLHLKRDKIEVESKQGDGPERKVTRLAIGLEGGFDADNPKSYETSETLSIVVLPNFITIPISCPGIPEQVTNCVKKIIELDSATKKNDIEAATGTWDGELRAESRHAKNLVQLDNNVKIPPSGWKCSRCDLTTNLWLNLTDGAIHCGRKFYDGTGGNEHALAHFRETGYPLVVKLGTITKEGKGDVYSYDEDDMVLDPHLIKHLSHFGININNMEKTDKSMAELEVDLNQKLGEWSTIQESGTQLEPLYGPGYTGLANMGNSCYLNSVMQVVFSLPHFINSYYNSREQILQTPNSQPASDFKIQMSKVAHGLLSGRYSVPPNETLPRKVYPPLAPSMFKHVIGRGHPEFSTKNQQDAQEFLLHLFTNVQRASRGDEDPTECFKMRVEDRFECSASGKVKYRLRTEYCLPLPIPLEAAVNKDAVRESEAAVEAKRAAGQNVDPNEIVRPRITLQSCLDAFSQTELVEQFYSSAINDKTTAKKTTRLSTFPEYLLIHMRKFAVAADWTPMKLDVEIDMPWEVDFAQIRGGVGQCQPGESLLPEGDAPPIAMDPATLASLGDMGFPIEPAKKAVYFTGNSGVEAAAQWLMDHMADPDFLAPFVPPGSSQGSQASAFVPNEEGLGLLMSMGFTREQATKALKATDNNVERAGDWIFSHAAELDQEETPQAAPQQENFPDGSTRYRLKAFISHMGKSSMVGHYVCHILKDNQWVIYNDEKVAKSEQPPKDLSYLYLYERIHN